MEDETMPAHIICKMFTCPMIDTEGPKGCDSWSNDYA